MNMSAGISQQFCVRWNSHLGSLGAAFPQLLAGQRFVDVTLACEGHQVHCHRLVLAACSTYFESLLGENPCKHPIIILPRDIKLWEIQALVDFMYKGEVNVSQAGLPDLLKCAEALQIRGLCGTDAALNLNHITNSTTTSSSSSSASTTNNNTSLHHITATNATASTLSTTTPATNNASTITPSNATSTPCISRSGSKVVIGPAITSPSGTTAGLDVTSSTSQITNILRTELLNAATIKLSAQSTTSNASSVSRAGTSISLDDGDDSANGSGSELNIKDDDESDLKMRVDYNDDLDGSGKLQSEFAMANVTCEYDSSASATDSAPGRRIRRSEAILRQAAECVSRGQTFQTVSDMFHIPISTIRFFMARKGILPRRKRGRASGAPFMSDLGGNSNRDRDREHSRSASPSEPPFHFANYKLPDLKHELL